MAGLAMTQCPVEPATHYVVDGSDDVVEESSEGTDLIQAVSFTAANNIENLTLTGSGNINATGNSLNNTHRQYGQQHN